MTSDHLDYLRLLVNGQAGSYDSHVQDAYVLALDRLSKVQSYAVMLAAFDAGVAYAQMIVERPDLDVMARTGRPSG